MAHYIVFGCQASKRAKWDSALGGFNDGLAGFVAGARAQKSFGSWVLIVSELATFSGWNHAI